MSEVTRRYFTVRDEAHRKLRCAKCRGFIDAGAAAVTVTGPGWTHAEHDDKCPPPTVHSYDPSRRVVQGSK